MALVRCPTHGLVYNEENPRGCPACALEKQGRRSQASIMQELAKASKKKERAEVDPAPPTPAAPEVRPQRRSAGFRAGPASGGAAWGVPGPATDMGEVRSTWDARRILTRFGPVAIILLVVTLLLLSRPSFVDQLDPPDFTGETRPLPIEARQPITMVFAILGTQSPAIHPRDPSVEQYSYGSDLVVDAINGFVYSLEIGVANRTWRGLQVGMSEREAEGHLALLAHPSPGAEDPNAQPETVSGYQVYPGPNERPVRTRVAAVRPPNGCYDVIVDVQPRQVGLLKKGEQRYSVVAREEESAQWVVTRIRVVDRSRQGPIDGRAC